MAAGLITVPFFLLVITQAAWASEVVGAVDGVAYLSPSQHEGYSRVHWRRNNDVKIAIWENGKVVQYPYSSYKGRLELFPNNTLKISHLQKSDSSVYQVYQEDNNGKLYIENINLTVYDLVPKPTVSAKVITADLELCNATLKCSVELEGVTYEWINPRKTQQKHVGASNQLIVSFNPSVEGGVETYICKVSNPVSSNNASLTYRHPCSWTGPPKCREQAVVAGGELWLLPEKPPLGWEKVDWRVRLDTGEECRILTAKRNKSPQFSNSPFLGRAFFQPETLSLRISRVTMADSGYYWAEFEDTTDAVTSLSFCVSVWEPLRQPLLETHILHREQDRCDLSLLCTVPRATSVSYSWSCTGGHPGALGHQPQLELQVPGDSDPTLCSCNATNPVSWRMATTDVTAACLLRAQELRGPTAA